MHRYRVEVIAGDWSTMLNVEARSISEAILTTMVLNPGWMVTNVYHD